MVSTVLSSFVDTYVVIAPASTSLAGDKAYFLYPIGHHRNVSLMERVSARTVDQARGLIALGWICRANLSYGYS